MSNKKVETIEPVDESEKEIPIIREVQKFEDEKPYMKIDKL